MERTPDHRADPSSPRGDSHAPEPGQVGGAAIDRAVRIILHRFWAGDIDERRARYQVLVLLDALDLPGRIVAVRYRRLPAQLRSDLRDALTVRLQDYTLGEGQVRGRGAGRSPMVFDPWRRKGSTVGWANGVCRSLAGDELARLNRQVDKVRPVDTTPAEEHQLTPPHGADNRALWSDGHTPEVAALQDAIGTITGRLRGKRRAERPFVEAEAIYRALGINGRLPRPALPTARSQVAGLVADDPAVAHRALTAVLSHHRRARPHGDGESSDGLRTGPLGEDLRLEALWADLDATELSRLATIGRQADRGRVALALVMAAVADRPRPGRQRIDRFTAHVDAALSDHGQPPPRSGDRPATDSNAARLAEAFVAAECEASSPYASNVRADPVVSWRAARGRYRRLLGTAVGDPRGRGRRSLAATVPQAVAVLRRIAFDSELFAEDHIFSSDGAGDVDPIVSLEDGSAVG